MAQNLDALYTTLTQVYKKDTDQEFPTNKIRFFMDFLWNALLEKPLTEEQKTSLKGLIDLLNSLDDHKLSPIREIITNLNTQLTPLLGTYPSLGHTFTFVVTTLLPGYQKYLVSLENLVKDSHAFTKEEVLLYYDMTLVDHAVLSHLFESESLNLVEVITSIKSVIIANALTHDYLQDSLARSISLFTFLQRGGLAKEQCHSYYMGLVDDILTAQKATVSHEGANSAVEYLCKKLVELTVQAASAPAPAENVVIDSAIPSQTVNEVANLDTLLDEKGPQVVEDIVENSHDPIDQGIPAVADLPQTQVNHPVSDIPTPLTATAPINPPMKSPVAAAVATETPVMAAPESLPATPNQWSVPVIPVQESPAPIVSAQVPSPDPLMPFIEPAATPLAVPVAAPEPPMMEKPLEAVQPVPTLSNSPWVSAMTPPASPTTGAPAPVPEAISPLTQAAPSVAEAVVPQPAVPLVQSAPAPVAPLPEAPAPQPPVTPIST